MRRLRASGGALVLGLTLANCLVWALVTPMFEGPDEYAHQAYAITIAEKGSTPTDGSPGAFTSTEHVFLLEATSSFALVTKTDSRPRWLAADERAWQARVEREHPRRDDGGGGDVTTRVHGPAYYALPAAAYKLTPGSLVNRLFAMRAITALLTALTALLVFATVRELVPGERWPALAAGLIVGFQPMFSFIGSMVNTDAGANLAAAALIYLLVRALRRGLTPGVAAAIPVTFVLGVLAKATMLALTPVLALALLLLAWRRAGSARAWGAMAGAAALVLLAWLPIAHALGRGYLTLPDAGPARADAGINGILSYLWQQFLPPLPFMTDLYVGAWAVPAWPIYVIQTWGAFGWLSVVYPDAVYYVIGVVLLGGILFATRALWIERVAIRERWAELLLIALAFVSVAAFSHVAFVRIHPGTGIAEQGRYLFPAITSAAVFAVGACYGLGRRWAPVAASALVAAVMLFNAFSQLYVFTRYYA